MLTTGGTIAGNVAGKAVEGIDESGRQVQEGLRDILAPTLQEIETRWAVDVEVHSLEICDVDSSDILPANWTELATAIHAHYDEYDGFIVTHGTNTMGYTCAALSFALPNLNKPVAVTGSQVPFGRPASDALMNLDNAVRIAAYPYEGGVRGVVCVFGSHIIMGTRVKKSTEFDLDPFRSFASAELGRIGRIIQMNSDNLKRHHSYLGKTKAPALMQRDLVIEAEFDPSLLSFTEFPGMSADNFQMLLEHAIDSDGANSATAVVFRAFGAGDASHHLHPCFAYLKDREIPVIVTTQAPNGNSNFMVNDPGKALAEGDLAIPSYDMSIEAVTTKLQWLLAKGIPHNEMRAAMHEDLHGEVTVHQEMA